MPTAVMKTEGISPQASGIAIDVRETGKITAKDLETAKAVITKAKAKK